MNVPVRIALLLLTLPVLFCACSKNATPPPEAPAAPLTAEGARPARVLPLPGEAPAAGQAAVGGGPLTWTVPAGWTEETPSSAMRQAQYRVPGNGGDGECIVFYFGPGQGGDAASNAIRWANQFSQPDGSSSVDAMTMEPLVGTPVPVQFVEVTGTYDGGMTMTDAPAERKEGHMLLGAIAQGPEGPWFFKFTGPESTVRDQREAFVALLNSLGDSGS